MHRREFLLSGLSIAGEWHIPLFTLPIDLANDLLIDNAYALWYNSPHVAPITNGFCLGFIASNGDVSVAQVSNNLELRSRTTIFGFSGASDHGSPALLRIPAGPHRGKLLSCFSNHSSELFSVRSEHPDSSDRWGAVRSVDEGRSTYASLSALPDGRILLVHTLQDKVGRYDVGEWRRTVVRITHDGGDSWTSPRTLIDFGAGTFPYSAPLSVSPTGRCALLYSLYSSKTKLHAGLTLAVSDQSFGQIVEIPIVARTPKNSNIVPYQSRWASAGELFVTYSVHESSDQSVVCKVSRITFDQNGRFKTMDTFSIGESAVHAYPAGVCLTPDCSNVIYCPPEGGIVVQKIKGDSQRRIATSGSFASPHVFQSGRSVFLTVLDNPTIKSTRNFRSNIRILKLR